MNSPVIFTTKYFRFTIILCFYFIFNNAQNDSIPSHSKQKSEFWKNVSFGGGIGLGFANGYTNIAISPSAVYKFNEQFALGPAINFNYSNQKNDFSATVIGASVVGLYKPVKELLFSAEFEQNNVSFKDKILDSKRNYWYPALYLGGGYALGNFGSIGVRYDVLFDDTKSVFGSAFTPFVRVYF